MAAAKTSDTANIVDECPEGKEWKLESNVKNLSPSPSSRFVTLGRGLPNRCLNICVINPENKTEKNIKIL